MQSPNRDCHKDCPSCTGACEPKQQDATIPAGTRVLMAWHTLAADPVLYPDPASFNPRRSVAGNAEDLANTNLGLDPAARGHAHAAGCGTADPVGASVEQAAASVLSAVAMGFSWSVGPGNVVTGLAVLDN